VTAAPKRSAVSGTLPDEQTTTLEFQQRLRAWLAAEETRLQPFRLPASGDNQTDHERGLAFQKMLFDEGWMGAGWPESVGGSGGNALLRAAMYDEILSAGYHLPDTVVMLEIMGEMFLRFAPTLAAQHLPAVINGSEVWCQGFSEPDAGSDLASLRCRATPGERGWLLNGQKVWTSFVQHSTRCLVLARTGAADSGHRGLTLFLVDLDTPGVTARTIRAMNGRDEFGEVFLDDTPVPPDRLIGTPGSGWAAAMYLLQWERGMYGWMRQAALFRRLRELTAEAGPLADAKTLGEAYLALVALRGQCRDIVRRLAAGESPGPEISVIKLLLAAAEKLLNDTARELLSPRLELDPTAGRWRAEYLYSRVSSIFGGSIEIQRQIVAERCLGLPRQSDR
jgi:alkylation response protein AidB-like acyl-CoA dehydrogenase